MAIKGSSDLKGKFEDGDRPTGDDFTNLVDSTLNSAITSLSADGVERIRLLSDGLSAIGDIYTTGDINVDGNINAKGTLTFGDADTDNVTFNADINSNVLPDANNTYNLGASGKTWANVYGHNLSAYNAVEAGETVLTKNLSATNDLNLDGNIHVGGTVDGRDVAADGTFLDTIYTNFVNVTGDTMTGNLVLSDANILLSGANSSIGIGIDENTPDEKLTVNGNISAAGTIKTDSTLSATKVDVNGNIKLGNAGGGGQLQYDTTNFYISDLRNNGSINFGILNGQVAIGENNAVAGEVLTVNGSSYLSGAVTTTSTISADDDIISTGTVFTTGGLISEGAVKGSSGTLLVEGSLSASGTIKTDSTLSATKVDVNGNIKLGNSGGGSQLQYDTTSFYIADLKNDAIRLGVVNGKVAVGGTTVSNEALLTVNGALSCATLSADGDIKVGNNGTTNKLIYDSTNLELFGAKGGIGTNLGIFNGQVGINTSDVGSGAALTVQGNTVKRGTDITTDTLTVSADSTKGLYVRQLSGDYSAAITSFNNGGNLYLYEPGVTNANQFDINLRGGNFSSFISAGNFGLGETEPGEKLTVQGTVSASGFKTDGSTGVTTNVTITATNAGTKTLTIKNGLIVSVA